ncbi:gamma-glutamylcyclotransferase, partial [bacterium]|nr:gamma-glutamylcyclotransferase [bacterium]
KGLWVFGYGSLIWNPAFRYAEKRPARLFGFHRSFCLYLTIGRGSPEKPGLMLALDRGGSCNGMAFRIATEDIESETKILWMREMISGAYNAHWGNLKADSGVIQGLTFVINRDHSRYNGKYSLDETVKALRRGEGYLGTCREYLENTVQGLNEINIHDKYLNMLCKRLNSNL